MKNEPLDPRATAHARATVPAPSAEDAPEVTTRPTLTPTSESGTPPAMAIDTSLELPERAFFDKLDERARRADMLAALLEAGGFSPADAARVLQASLAAVVTSATEAGLPSLARLATALRACVGNLGIAPAADDEMRVVDTLVYDESELQRDLVALAVESQGHTVRCAATYEEFLRELEQRRPALLITELEHEKSPARFFCGTLKELLYDKRVPLVIFSRLDVAELEPLAQQVRARRHVSKDRGIDALITELREVYTEILAIRVTGRMPAFRLER